MIVLDTSALMAILLEEAGAHDVARVIEATDQLAISAGTLAESLIVARRRWLGGMMSKLIEDLGVEIVALTPAGAADVADAYDRWGKGVHPAGLNFGDCFAYALAASRSWPLLYVGNDFSGTDVTPALAD